MKRRILRLTLVTCFILAVTALFSVSSSAATYGDLNYTVSNGKVKITDCATSATSVTIPSTINGYPVTSIGDSAFYNCTSLTSISIPDSVTSIGTYAFYNCTSLTRVDITDMAAWCNIVFDDSSYSNPLCYARKLYLNGTLVTDLTIPDGVTSIGNYSFYNCTSLTSVTIPDSVTSIGSYAFRDCTNLTSISIPDSVTTIDYGAFYNCTSLTSITIPDSVTSIGSYAFYNCTSLTSISIPDSVKSIGRLAFYNCTSLTSVNIPDFVTSIGEGAFQHCSSLTSVNIPDSVTSIGDAAFCNCSSLTSISIPDSVTSIGYAAFCNCSSLTSISIPDSVTSIGDLAFSSCTSLTSISIPDSVTSIGEYAFDNCTSLTSVNIPDSVTSIGSSAFYNCSSLTRVDITDIAAWCKISFNGDSSNPLYYAKKLYLNSTQLTDLTIPDSVTSIGIEAFLGCSSLTSITIPDSVTSIGNSAFYNCTSLTSIYYNAANVSDLSSGNCVFYNAGQSGEGIKVTIGKDVENIPARLFCPDNSSSYAPKITEVVFEDGSVCKSIGSYAFYYCTSLTRVNITDIATWCNIEFSGYYSNPLNYAKNLYLNGTLVTDLTIPDGVTSIGSSAFSGCTSLTSISIPDSVTSIGNSAFYNCTSLASIYYNAANLSDLSSSNFVFDYAGQSGEGIKVTIGKDVKHVPAYLFCPYSNNSSSSPKITEVVFEEGSVCASIGDSAFSRCTSLTSIDILEGVTNIGNYAFSRCTSLASISIPDSVTSIGREAFYGCSNLNTVYYCGTAEEWNGISIGSDNTLLTNATRKYHKYTWTTTEPTCTEDGKKITKCEFCDFESNEIIPALGHSWSDWGEKIAPTCSVSGFERRTCSACDSQENRIVAPRHTWGEWDVHAEPTCTDSGSRSRNCQACGVTETEELGILGHDEVTYAAQAPTCTSVGWHEYTACTRCGQNNYVEIPALGHFWEEWHTVIYPTADSVGFKERCCANCTDEEFDYVYFASGDVDGDGTLTNADLTIAVRTLSGWTTDGVISQVDINYDGKINNRDIIVFIQKLAGRELVYRVDPSNIQNRIYTSVKYSEPSSTDEVLCVSLDLEQRITLFRGYLTCEIVYGEAECPSEEHFDYNGMSYHNVKGGADEWTNVEISDEYITISFADEVLKLELLSNDTLRVVEAVNSSEISAGDVFG